MEKQELELALKQYGEQLEKKQAEIKAASDKALQEKADELKKELEALKAERKAVQEQMDAISTAQAKAAKEGVKGEEVQSLEVAIKNLLNSDEFKSAKKAGFQGNKVFELKAATTDITGTVNMTVQKLGVGFAPLRALAFIPYTNAGTLGQDKNRVLWVEGAYTSNVGYVSEGTGAATADAGTATEKTRAMAKISAKLPLTAEMLEDADYIASAFRMKMQEKAMLYTDLQVYSGDGNDSTQANHIYGIVGHATAFSAATAGVSAAIQNANIGDLIDACLLQARLSEQNGLNVVWMNPADFFRLKKAKDEVGNYLFVKDINGNYTISGLQVVQSSAVTANTLTVADTSKIQQWWKRNPEIKFSQMNGTDFVDDKYTAVMFLRTQVVVEAQDKTAIIHVADINASVTAITLV